MTDNTKYYIWLTLGLGFASYKPYHIMALYDDVEVFYKGGESEMRLCGILTENEINKLLSAKLSDAEKIIEESLKLGYTLLDISEYEYPQILRSIDNAPAVLYIDGKLPDFDEVKSVSIVGTRKATVYGVRTAYELGANLSKRGFVVVSGGALGIDCAAHRGVLQAGGRTVCVLGCGLDTEYLRENKAMRKQIAQRGAVISEYPPGTPASPQNFPQRNRIISGLTYGTVVVEAPVKSGSMITVNLALEQCRDVFAVMGNIDSPYSEGSNALIKDGAIPVTSYKDISEFYLGVDNSTLNNLSITIADVKDVPTKLKNPADTTREDNIPVAAFNSNVTMTDEENEIYFLLSHKPMHVDKIVEEASLPAHTVLRTISSLELKGLIRNTEGRNYVII
ncbi:MAG: DNA-processing protein DprA [Eubacteriales bacterium]|nr:DNA-processing protein DprA [Eubacteriales bacterium]